MITCSDHGVLFCGRRGRRMAGQEGRVGREVTSAWSSTTSWTLSGAPPASGGLVQDRNRSPPCWAHRTTPSVRWPWGSSTPPGWGDPPGLPSGRGLHSKASGSGPCSWSCFVGTCHFPPNNSSAGASVRVRDRLQEAALREVAGDEFTPTAVPRGGRLGVPLLPASLSLFDFIAVF